MRRLWAMNLRVGYMWVVAVSRRGVWYMVHGTWYMQVVSDITFELVLYIPLYWYNVTYLFKINSVRNDHIDLYISFMRYII